MITETDTPKALDTPKILLVDDEPKNLDVLEAILEPADCTFVKARSADEALLALLHHDFAAIVLDIRMPGLGGIELAKIIKQRKRSQHIPIVFLTAHMLDDEDVLRGYGVGAVDYLSRPINPEILRSKVGVFVELFRKTRALGELNEALQREIAEREEAQHALQRANEELERRVQQRTAELTRALRDAREARDEAQLANRAKDEFLAMLSHELRNPLNVIAGGIAILDSSGKPEERAARTRELIGRQVRHLTNLMDDLLDIARVTSGKIVLNRQPLDLGATVAGCLAALRDANRLRQHSCHEKIDSVWAEADATRLEQIITNLIGNAIKFTPAGGEIRVEVRAQEGDAILCVEDTGVGIAPDLLPRIFDVFVQADRTVERGLGGLGVGLTLVRRLTELHGGSVVAESEGIGRGASFTVRLPRIAAPPTRSDRVTRKARLAKPSRILVAEDNADGREMLRTMLELGGHEVYETSDGDSAVELALTLQPDTAIIDIGLPGRDGYVVAAEIRASEVGGRRMRLIALTGYGSEEDRRRAVAAGFDAHLTKPVEPDRLALLLASAGMDCEQEPGDASASVGRTTLSRSFVPGGRPIAGGGRSH